ncbi:CPBP family intramembrane glutamic endopeptidase [Paucibacter sp. XJ19-41]|uniref:CPBP family intramembrane glutamic endopeptidase n=1 Tax=Paucibacter sp. XJ19-41 TaxID=2927824 RepID=UPI00234B6831|nr:type II CAAX endopeptidase family protein [Paucibacter sp. XJ19-41]MDC6170640.1 type II CAAX endopeptidase family protein [Paucibacter sp. XJ19-41]
MNVENLRESALVRGATETSRPTAWWLAAMLIFGVGVVAVGLVVSVLYGMVLASTPGSLGAQWMEFFTNAGALLALWLWLRFKERRAFASVGFRDSAPLRQFGIGLLIGAGMITLSLLILLATGQYQLAPSPAQALGGTAALLPVVMLLVVWAVQSSTEETLMRGYLLQTAALQLPGWLAILLPGLLFSAVHFATEGILPVAGINIAVFAILASFVALRQGSLWMACGIHTGWNWFQGNVFNVPVSGNAYTTGIVHLRPVDTAPQWLSGGAFGPENSVVVTLVWGVAALVAYRRFRRCGHTAAPQ